MGEPNGRPAWGALAVLCAIVALSAVFHLWGIRRNLPVIPQMDEVLLYEPAIRIASTGDLNPRWFGYPGSTVIYPSALAAHVWQAIVHGGGWLRVGSQWPAILQQSGYDLVLIGRLVSVAYSLAALVVLFLLGRTVFGTSIALAGTLLAALCPTTVDYAQQLRTDGPAMFFGLLYLFFCLRLLRRPGWSSSVLAGASLGFGLATRVLLAATAPALLLVDLVRWHRATPRGDRLTIWQIAAGIACVPLAFVLATPYAVLDPGTAWSSFHELAAKQNTHLGADGLGPAGNFWWYVSTAMPLALTWPQMALAVVGIASILRSREPAALLTIVYLVGFVGGISMVGLHWDRWLLPVLPIMGLHAALGAYVLLDAVARGRVRDPASPRRRVLVPVLVACVALALVIAPTRTLVAAARLHSTPTTDVVAAQWITANLPATSLIARERNTAPISERRYVVLTFAQLPERTFDEYVRLRVDYVLASSSNWMRFQNEAARYATEVAFYQELNSRAQLVKQFAPSADRGGPIVRIYALSPRARAFAATVAER